MKSKNLFLGICAFGLAIGSAFATLAPETAYVKAQAQPGDPFVCTSTAQTCDNTGTRVCQVQITVNGVSTIVPATKIYRSGCVTVLKDNTLVVKSSPLSVYAIQ